MSLFLVLFVAFAAFRTIARLQDEFVPKITQFQVLCSHSPQSQQPKLCLCTN